MSYVATIVSLSVSPGTIHTAVNQPASITFNPPVWHFESHASKVWSPEPNEQDKGEWDREPVEVDEDEVLEGTVWGKCGLTDG